VLATDKRKLEDDISLRLHFAGDLLSCPDVVSAKLPPVLETESWPLMTVRPPPFLRYKNIMCPLSCFRDVACLMFTVFRQLAVLSSLWVLWLWLYWHILLTFVACIPFLRKESRIMGSACCLCISLCLHDNLWTSLPIFMSLMTLKATSRQRRTYYFLQWLITTWRMKGRNNSITTQLSVHKWCILRDIRKKCADMVKVSFCRI
jgi:hypothetical protein